MKTHYALSTLFALVATITSAQTIAEGLTYDPCESYYSTYYSGGAASIDKQAPIQKATDNTKNLSQNKSDSTLAPTSSTDVTNPANYYNW